MKTKTIKLVTTFLSILIIVQTTLPTCFALNKTQIKNTQNKVEQLIKNSIKIANAKNNNLEISHRQIAQAQATGSKESKPQPTKLSEEATKLYKQLILTAVSGVKVLKKIIWPVLLLIGPLLQNDLLYGGTLEEVSRALWVNIRNFVNIMFVLVLLGIALFNIVGGNQDDYKVKTIMPKFILAVVLVNFSFLGVKVVADGVTVLSTAIFALPNNLQLELNTPSKTKFVNDMCEGFKNIELEQSSNNKNNEKTIFNKFCKEKQSSQDSKINTAYADSTTKNGDEESTKYELSNEGKLYLNTFSAKNAALVMAINLGKIGSLDKINLENKEVNLENLFIGILFSAIIYIIYATAFIALFIVLLARVVVLWVVMILSPLLVLKTVLPSQLQDKLGTNEWGSKFIQTVIVPIPVAFMMSIGYIMLTTLQQQKFLEIFSDIKLGNIVSGMSTFQDLLVAVAMVIVIWTGIFASIKGTVADSIVESIEGAVSGAGKFLATAPFKYLPIFPVKGGSYSAESVKQLLTTGIPNQLNNKTNQKAQELGNELGFNGSATFQQALNAKNYNNFIENISSKAASQEASKKENQKQLATTLKNNRKILTSFVTAPGVMQTLGYSNTSQFMGALSKGNVSNTKLQSALQLAGIVNKYKGKKTETTIQQMNTELKNIGITDINRRKEIMKRTFDRTLTGKIDTMKL